MRTRSYFFGNTWLDEANFEYHATQKQILFGQVIAVILAVIYVILSKTFPVIDFAFLLLLAVESPWIVWRSLQFNARMSGYRNVRFSFNGRLRNSFKYLLLIPLIPIGVGIAITLAMLLAQVDDDPVYAIVIAATFLGFYLMIPYIQALFTRYRINHSHYGQGSFAAELPAGAYYLII